MGVFWCVTLPVKGVDAGLIAGSADRSLYVGDVWAPPPLSAVVSCVCMCVCVRARVCACLFVSECD